MSKLTSAYPTIIDFDVFSGSTVQQTGLGTTFRTSDKREFTYALAGAALTAGNVGVEPAAKANHMGINPSAAAPAGSSTVSVTLGATALVAGEYNEGWLMVSGAPGNGQYYGISYNLAAASGAVTTVGLTDAVNVALNASSVVNLVHNPANGAQEGTVQTRLPVGVPMANVASGGYYFAQSRGYAAVADDAATAAAVGSAMVLSGTVSGAITASSSTFSATLPVVATNTLAATVASKNSPVFLTID